jgi:transaldolase
MAPNPNLNRLHEAGVSIWLDTLSRQLLQSGEFAELIEDFSVTGATSNPTIFAKAITGSDLYDEQLRGLAAGGERDTQELFFALALDDVREAARLLRPAYDSSGGRDGFISFECTPDLADDTEATIAQATELWQRLDRPNVMIMVPGTEAGLPAIEELTRRGVNVNVTLLFSIERYEEVIDAYLRGLRARVQAGESIEQIASVASFFLSRIDTKVDAQLPEDSPLRGGVALASARVAYQRCLGKFAGDAWERLGAVGATPQRPLWASTGTKNPDYPDVLYVSELIGPGVVNTMPGHTLRAFAHHGQVARTLDADPDAAERTLADAATAGIDLAAVTAELEREGVQSFCDSYHQLLDCIEGKLGVVTAAAGEAHPRRRRSRSRDSIGPAWARSRSWIMSHCSSICSARCCSSRDRPHRGSVRDRARAPAARRDRGTAGADADGRAARRGWWSAAADLRAVARAPRPLRLQLRLGGRRDRALPRRARPRRPRRKATQAGPSARDQARRTGRFCQRRAACAARRPRLARGELRGAAGRARDPRADGLQAMTHDARSDRVRVVDPARAGHGRAKANVQAVPAVDRDDRDCERDDLLGGEVARELLEELIRCA